MFTAYLNEETGIPNFNEDTEFCYCTLSKEMVRRFMEIGKEFYSIETKLHYETGEIKKIILFLILLDIETLIQYNQYAIFQ